MKKSQIIKAVAQTEKQINSVNANIKKAQEKYEKALLADNHASTLKRNAVYNNIPLQIDMLRRKKDMLEQELQGYKRKLSAD